MFFKLFYTASIFTCSSSLFQVWFIYYLYEWNALRWLHDHALFSYDQMCYSRVPYQIPLLKKEIRISMRGKVRRYMQSLAVFVQGNTEPCFLLSYNNCYRIPIRINNSPAITCPHFPKVFCQKIVFLHTQNH